MRRVRLIRPTKLLVDLVDKNLTGKEADAALGRANITVNKNSVPNDPKSPFVTSGIRVGTAHVTRFTHKRNGDLLTMCSLFMPEAA